MTQPYLVVCGLLLLAAVLIRAMPTRRASRDTEYEDGFDLTARELGYLRRGRYGVVLTVLAQLHGEGAVDLSGSRRVHRLDPPRDCDDRLAVAIYAGLNRTSSPRLLALLPSIGRECAPLRQELAGRRLRPSTRRWWLTRALRVYAIGLAFATMLEQDARGAAVTAALVVAALAVVVGLGPRRTVAGGRELRMHRAALVELSEAGDLDGSYLDDLVAAHGRGAIDVLCGPVIGCGGLALPRFAPLAPPSAVPGPAVGGTVSITLAAEPAFAVAMPAERRETTAVGSSRWLLAGAAERHAADRYAA